MTEDPTHLRLGDFLVAVRRRGLLIAAVTIIAAAVSGAIALSQAKTYTARTTLEALDPSQTAGYAELTQYDVNASGETAAQLAETATQTAILRAVKARLGLPDSIGQIRSRLTLSEDQQSDYVLLDASAPTASGAAALADAAADQVARISNRAVRAHFAAVAAQERASALALLTPYAGKSPLQLSPAQQVPFRSVTARAIQLEQLAGDLEGFSKLVTVAQVAAPASLPNAPSSPHPVTSIAVGAGVGLAVGLLLALWLEFGDRRISRPEEAAAVVSLPVIGGLPKGNLGKLPGEYADPAAMAAFGMIWTNARFLDASGGPPRIIAVTSAIPGEGRTTMALGLAVAAASSGRNTLLIEADPRRAALAERLGLNPAPGLVEYFGGSVSLEAIVRTCDVGGSRLACITAGEAARAAKPASRDLTQLLSELTGSFDAVLIDSGPLLSSAETVEVVPIADCLLFCVRTRHTTAEQLRRAQVTLGRLPRRPGGLVITDLEPDADGYYGQAYASDESSAARNREVSASASGVPIS